jgi:hypothetical protein
MQNRQFNSLMHVMDTVTNILRTQNDKLELAKSVADLRKIDMETINFLEDLKKQIAKIPDSEGMITFIDFIINELRQIPPFQQS